jgi:hypothetical protein
VDLSARAGAAGSGGAAGAEGRGRATGFGSGAAVSAAARRAERPAATALSAPTDRPSSPAPSGPRDHRGPGRAMEERELEHRPAVGVADDAVLHGHDLDAREQLELRRRVVGKARRQQDEARAQRGVEPRVAEHPPEQMARAVQGADRAGQAPELDGDLPVGEEHDDRVAERVAQQQVDLELLVERELAVERDEPALEPLGRLLQQSRARRACWSSWCGPERSRGGWPRGSPARRSVERIEPIPRAREPACPTPCCRCAPPSPTSARWSTSTMPPARRWPGRWPTR